MPGLKAHPTESETGIARKVAADAQAHLELEAAEAGPDPASAALLTPALRSQGVRPVSEDQPKGVTCPECSQPLVIAPKGGKRPRTNIAVTSRHIDIENKMFSPS